MRLKVSKLQWCPSVLLGGLFFLFSFFLIFPTLEVQMLGKCMVRFALHKDFIESDRMIMGQGNLENCVKFFKNDRQLESQ